jgi:type IV secretory pathway TraG/TraD family ATPase VirD4
MSETVDTRHAGETNPYSGGSERNNILVAIIGATVIAPFIILTAFIVWLLFSYGKIRRSVILAYFGLYILVLGWTIPVFGIPLIINNTGILFDIIFSSGTENIWIVLSLLLLGHLIVGAPVGVLVGLAYASWRWIRRPIWQEYDFKPAPWEIWKGKKTIKDIQQDLNTPFDGLTLGVNSSGERVIQTDTSAAAHTLVVGASGSGKTTTLMSKARDAVKRGQALIFVDLKGGNDIPQILHKFAKRYGREFKHWTIQPLDVAYKGPSPEGPACYDPLSRGDATRRKDLLIASRDWSEEFYKIEASNYLQLLFHTMILNPKPEVSTLSDVVSLLSPQALLSRAERAMEQNIEYSDILSGIESLNDPRISQAKRNAIEGLRSQLEVILNSAAGRWLLVNPNGNNINIKEAAHKGQVIVFSLDSSNYPELAALVANLIIQDLKTVSSELRDDPASSPTQIFIDEFSAIGSDNIIGLINKSRDAGLPVTLSTQALGDLRRVNEAFLDQLLGIINSFIVHRANKDDDAIVYAGLTGTVKKKRFAQTVEYTVGRFGGIGKGSGTGGGRVEEYEDYRVSPNEIQELQTGEMIYLTKSPNALEKVTVIPEEKLETIIEPDSVQYQTVTTSNISLPSIVVEKIPEIIPSIEKPQNNITQEFNVEPSDDSSFIPKPPDMQKIAKIFNKNVEEEESEIGVVKPLQLNRKENLIPRPPISNNISFESEDDKDKYSF